MYTRVCLILIPSRSNARGTPLGFSDTAGATESENERQPRIVASVHRRGRRNDLSIVGRILIHQRVEVEEKAVFAATTRKLTVRTIEYYGLILHHNI